MTRDIQIQFLRPEDYPAMQTLVQQVNAQDALAYSLSREWFDYVVTEVPHRVWVAREKGGILGVATLFDETSHPEPGLATANVVVLPDRRKQGVGSRLYQALITAAGELGLQQVRTVIKTSLSDSIAFVKSRGFETLWYSWQLERNLVEAPPAPPLPEWQRRVAFRPFREREEELYRRLMEDGFDDPPDLGTLQMIARDPSITPWVMWWDDEPVGMLTVQTKSRLSTAYIYDILVKQKCQGQGLGNVLLQHALKEMAQKQLETVTLLVEGENENALALYRKNGFQVTDTYRLYRKVLDPEGPRDQV